MRVRRQAGLALVAVLAAAVAGCGSSDSKSGGSTSTTTTAAATQASSGGSGGRTTGIGPLTGAAMTKAQTEGAAAAKAAGSKVALPAGKKIGLLQVVGGIESADRLANAVKFVSGKLGYKYVYCDGQGVPDKQLACANSLLSQGVDAIVTPGVDPSTIAGAIRQARSKKIPIFAVGGVQPPGYDGSYGPDETKVGKVLADYFVKRMGEVSGSSAPIAVSDFPTPTFHLRTVQLANQLNGQSKIKVVAKSTPDFANLIQGTQKTVTDQLTANPNLKGMWFAFDTTGQAAGQVVSSRFPGKSFPDKPLVVTFHADLATLDLVRKGSIDAVGEVPYDAGVYVGMDQVLEFFARGTKMATANQPSYPGIGQVYNYKIVDKSNLPPKDQYVAPENDVVTYFLTKWKNEFGIAG